MTVVCVHGFGVTGAYFRPFARALAQPTLVPTLPGWGGAQQPDHVLDLHELADELAGRLDRHGLERASFVANSFGCQIVVELAIRAPERVEALVLVGPTIDPHTRPLVRFLAMFLADTLREPLSLWFLIARDCLRTGPRTIIRTGRFAWRHRLEQRLLLVEAPTLVVRGERDGFVTQRWCEEAVALLQRGELAVVDGAHAVHYTAPREVARLVEVFLEDATAGRSA